ncbi:hypothetical protein G7077_10145 [Sphingomonas piscis]|uniref:Uncharacterized protein n=1 Tax=Sphingomonas piscis TaxID=2714943 RepID=A0A6G7YR35_9SPHN|nr:hypothetical protein [Sphingomonas piscis]QIK79201.1 hypothetical protein G7077_10145 [Sphingomonas piscis]
MTAIKYLLAGGAGLAAMAAATPASAQIYPGYGYGGGNVVGQVLGQILNPGYGGYNSYGGYGMNSQAAVNQCAAAVTDRVNRQYGGYAGYGGYNGGARVAAITSVEPRSNGKMRVRGIAQSAAYGGYNGVPQEFAFKCNVDYRGYITDIDLDRTNTRYGYGTYNSPYQPYGTYRRY